MPDPHPLSSAAASSAASTTIDVRFYELDPYGHVNHGVYLNYFEVARIELLDAIGFGLPRLGALGFHLVVVEARVRFHAPAHAGDRLTVTSRLRSLRRTSAVWDQTLDRAGTVIATNEVRSGITDTTGRPTAAPPELLEALAPFRIDDDRTS
ncbi:MAG: acyl-CoA thioesterase [Nitriliruptoraceae bacterium]|nr:acyl-CoA thioesterase [Nitriliruptoraceae bacterium]